MSDTALFWLQIATINLGMVILMYAAGAIIMLAKIELSAPVWFGGMFGTWALAICAFLIFRTPS